MNAWSIFFSDLLHQRLPSIVFFRLSTSVRIFEWQTENNFESLIIRTRVGEAARTICSLVLFCFAFCNQLSNQRIVLMIISQGRAWYTLLRPRRTNMGEIVRLLVLINRTSCFWFGLFLDCYSRRGRRKKRNQTDCVWCLCELLLH